MTRQRIIALFERRTIRRIGISPVTVLAAIIGLGLSPLLLLAAVCIDVIKKRRRWPTLRLVVLIVGALVIETVGIAVSVITWLLTGCGLLGKPRWRWHMHRSYMGWYTATMLGLITRVIGAPVHWRDTADLSSGPVVLLARHTSFFDALIPATLLCRRNKLLAHHVVTQGLRYLPCIDIVGHRFPNRFIKRSPGEGSAELAHIEAVGAALDSRSAAIIFPEGTFRSPARFERILRRMRRRRPELAQQAEQLLHVLPPRANGTYALLAGAPDADVVICTNTGFESFGTLKAIRDRPFANTPIVIETWRIARADIPADPDGFGQWLLDQYATIDDWVENEVTTKRK